MNSFFNPLKRVNFKKVKRVVHIGSCLIDYFILYLDKSTKDRKKLKMGVNEI